MKNPDADFGAVPRAPLDDLRAVLLAESRIDDPHQPQPMAAGLFGYLGYDMVRYMERLPDCKNHRASMCRKRFAGRAQPRWRFSIRLRIKLRWLRRSGSTKPQSAETAYDGGEGAAGCGAGRSMQHGVTAAEIASGVRKLPHLSAPAVQYDRKRNYCGMVERAKEYIRAGDIFQVVLSQRFSKPFTLPPFDLYRAIRRLDPSPFLFFFDFGNFSVVGSSPEILVRVRDGKVTIRPIAGTRSRGLGNRSDSELAAELLADPKELAEHLMLLDLGRNDAGRVAKTGTVKVTSRNTIEYYKHVMHIVSNVEGELDEKFTPLDALIGGFPAGTVSGAPKVRAMEIINELEPDRRGIYGGCIGYFGANGNMDTAIAIRTAVVKDGVMHVQAGAGIVYDSDPQSEYRECVAKARGLMRAAGEGIVF